MRMNASIKKPCTTYAIQGFNDMRLNNQTPVSAELQHLNVGRAWAFCALTNFKADFLVFFEGLVTARTNFRVVSEQILAAAVRHNKTITFFGIEPLHDTSCHFELP